MIELGINGLLATVVLVVITTGDEVGTEPEVRRQITLSLMLGQLVTDIGRLGFLLGSERRRKFFNGVRRIDDRVR